MLLHKDGVEVVSKNKKSLKLYLTFVIIDILGILYIKEFFSDFDVLRYTFIRVTFISFSIGIVTLRQIFTLGRRLWGSYNHTMRLINDIDDEEVDEEVAEEKYSATKGVFKEIVAIIEVGILFGIQSGMIVYFRNTFETAGSYNIIICLLLMGTLTYMSRVRLNNKYNL